MRFYCRFVEFSVRVAHPLHLRNHGGHLSVAGHAASGRSQDQNAVIPEQIQRFMVRRSLRAKQVRGPRILQGDRSQIAKTYADGGHVLDNLRADVAEYWPEIIARSLRNYHARLEKYCLYSYRCVQQTIR